MQKLPKLNVNYCFFLLVSLSVFSCNPKKAPEATAELNTTFESTPPVATEIRIKILEKETNEGNVLLTARFNKNEIREKFHAVNVNDEKLVLRDDGLGGDEVANDGLFSITLKENISEIRAELNRIKIRNRAVLESKRNIFKWVNRSAVSITEKLKRLDESRIDTSQLITIDPDIVFLHLPDPLLNDRSLMVTDLGVVEDPARTFNPCTNAGTPNGAWTFGKLIADMTNQPVTGVTPENFVKEWLDKWMNAQTVNGDNIAPRTNIFNSIIRPWILKSNPGVDPATITMANWKTKLIQLQFAPFRLLAIVNRVDLRGNSGYTLSNAGEGRFVFGALNSNCQPLTGPGKFAIIFEYAVPKKTCSTLKAYAQQWINLKTLTPGSVAYNNELQAITDQFTVLGLGGSKPNGSSLNQLRTNELAIGNPWELREFVISASTHLLEAATVKQEPAKIFNRMANPTASVANQTILANFVNTNEADVLNNRYTIPNSFSGANFLGGKAHTEQPNHFWDASATAGASFITNNDARQIVSINTCSGCHGGEGQTSSGNLINDPAGVSHNAFLHIAPQPFGVKATLSAFLTGDPSDPNGLFKVTDPANRPTGAPTVRSFNDLARRNVDLQELAEQSCKNRLFELIRVLKFKPVRMTH